MNDPSYHATRWQATLLIIGTVVAVSAFNIFLAKHLSLSEGIFAICHVFAFFPIVISLWVLTDPKQPAREVFLHFTDNGGQWPRLGLSVLVGQVSCMFVVLGSDGVAHLAEEIEDAGRIVPQSMIWGYLLNAPLAICLAVTYCFNMPSVERAIQSTMPFVTVFQEAFQHDRVTTAFGIVMLLLVVMITISALASTSRQIFAFA